MNHTIHGVEVGSEGRGGEGGGGKAREGKGKGTVEKTERKGKEKK
jgi:hypothetical protein